MQKGIKKFATGAISAVTAFGLAGMPVAAAGVTKPNWAFNGDLGSIITMVLHITFGVGILLALAYLIWGAFNWITSGGDKAKTGEARSKIVAAVVGLILLAASWGILTIVLTMLGAGTIEGAINDNIVNVKSKSGL